MYKCRECGATFDEPYRIVERHGFTTGPYEVFEVCPECEGCDWDDAYVVEHEARLELEAEADEPNASRKSQTANQEMT